MDIYSNSGKSINECTCGYCNPVPTRCRCGDYCNVPVCPFAIKEQCPIKQAWDNIDLNDKLGQTCVVLESYWYIPRYSVN